jgi:hypothetical protein
VKVKNIFYSSNDYVGERKETARRRITKKKYEYNIIELKKLGELKMRKNVICFDKKEKNEFKSHYDCVIALILKSGLYRKER